MTSRSAPEIHRLLALLSEQDAPEIDRAAAAEALGHLSAVSKNHTEQSKNHAEHAHALLCHVADTLRAALFDKSKLVRVASTHALVSLPSSKEQLNVETLLGKLSDPDGLVRRATMQSLGLLASRGDIVVVTALLNQVKKEKEVLAKVAAIEALMHVALELGDPSTPNVLDFRITLDKSNGDPLGIGLTETLQRDLRIARIEQDGLLCNWNAAHPEALVLVGDHIVEVNGIHHTSEDNIIGISDELRTPKVLQITIDRNAEVITVLKEALAHDEDAIVRAAADSLRVLGRPHDPEIVEALLYAMDCDDPSPSVVRALTAMPDMRDERMLTVLAGSQGVGAQSAAHEALKQQAVDEFDEHSPIVTALSSLMSQDHMARCEAIKTLGAITNRGNGAVVQGLLARLQDDHTLVRAEAAWALGKVADKGDRGVLQALIVALGHHEPVPTASGDPEHLRTGSAWALGEIAQPGNDQVAKALWRSLSDPAEKVRQMALKAHERIDVKGTERVSVLGKKGSLWHEIPLLGRKNVDSTRTGSKAA